MSTSSLDAMLSSYAVTYDNAANEYDNALKHEAYLDRLDAFTFS